MKDCNCKSCRENNGLHLTDFCECEVCKIFRKANTKSGKKSMLWNEALKILGLEKDKRLIDLGIKRY
jgi:hypothetical protein